MPKRQRNKARYVNIGIYPETHEELRKLGAKGESFAAIVQRLTSDVQRIWFEVLSVDEKDPKGFRIIYRLGNAKYLTTNGKTALIEKVLP